MRKFIRPIFQILLIIFITLLIIELVLQAAFLNLPQAITQRMPQYPERYGIKFDTVHGAREYPANEHVNFEVTQFSGDLFQVSCLSPKDAVPIEPYIVEYERDNHGFRNSEPWSESVDLVILGDSFTAAESINSPYWESLSENMLVLGLPGSGTLEQSILYDYFALPRSPKTVILAYFGGNDLTDNLTFHQLQEDGATFADKTHQNRNPLEYLVSFHLALFIKDALSQSAQPDCPYPIETNQEPTTSLTFFDSMVSLLTISQNELQTSNIVQLTRETILELANHVAQNGGRFVLMYIPQKAEVYWHLLDDSTQQAVLAGLPTSPIQNNVTDAQSVKIDLEAQRNLLQSLASDNDFTMLDLTPFLIEAVDNGKSPYFFADTHWNQNGHEIVHRVIVEFLAGSTLDENSNS